MKIVEERKGVHVDVNQFTLAEVKKRLWKNGLSLQEFLSYVVYLLATGDNRVYDLLVEAKVNRAKKETVQVVHTDEESLYSLMERLREERKQESTSEKEKEVRYEEG